MTSVELRDRQGEAALYRLEEAVRRIPRQDATARAWLRAQGLVHSDPRLGELVIWGDVLAAIRRGGLPEEPAERTLPRSGLQRESLPKRRR